jgi:NitT/TauT family transport system ATP-binding protein
LAALIELDKVALRFPGAAGPVFADIDLVLVPGEFTIVVGASGAGKSTLLRIVAGLLAPSAGIVRRHVAETPERCPIALVFQEPRLMPWRSVADNVALGLEGLALDAAERHRRALAALALVGLADYAERWPHALSGGQRQRVGIARALAVEPDLLLMDEPVRRARRHHPGEPAGRAAAHLAEDRQVDPLRHPRHRGGDLSR